MKILSVFCLLILSFTSVLSQDHTQKEVQKTEMVKLEKLVGQWRGSGWIQQSKNREEFTGTEVVQAKIDGLALLIEGKFTDKNNSSKVIHETLAVLSYNPQTNIYDFQTFLASGTKGLFKFAVKDENYEWYLDFPGNKILYTITIKNNTWHEIGKISRDNGKTWFQFFEMTLKKI